MTITTVLLHCDNDADYPLRRRVSLDLARQYEAHLLVVAVEPRAENIPGLYGRGGYLGQELKLARQRLSDAEQVIKEECALAEVPCTWYWENGQPLDCLSRRSYHADLAVVSQTPSNSLEDMLFDYSPDHLAMTGGCPVLILPKGYGKEVTLNHPLVGWKNRREAAQALHGALPLLKRARKVSIVSVNPEDGEEILSNDLLQWLARHGVTQGAFHVRNERYGDTADILTEEAQTRGCDFLIMGSYSQSRLRELILGGVTRSFLTSMSLPILMTD